MFMSIFPGALAGALIFLTSNVRADGVPADCTQLILAIAPDWNSTRGKLQLFERPRGGNWSAVAAPVPVLLGKNGLAWGTGLAGQNERGLRKKERSEERRVGKECKCRWRGGR